MRYNPPAQSNAERVNDGSGYHAILEAGIQIHRPASPNTNRRINPAVGVQTRYSG